MACRHANVIITVCYRTYFRDKIFGDAETVRQRLYKVKRLLHSSPTGESQSDGDSQSLCERFALYFRRKVTNIEELIKAKLIGGIYNPLTFDRR